VETEEVYTFKVLGMYPINTLRNVAFSNARTSHVLVLDVDFILSKGALGNLIAIWPSIDTLNTAFVVPAFEIDMQATLPSTKRELISLVTSGLARQVRILFKTFSQNHL
jgi:hypothetical protein